MVVSIELDARTEARLRQQAQAAGKDVNAYVSQLVERAAAKPSLDEVLTPIRLQFAGSGTSDEQLIADITGRIDNGSTPFSEPLECRRCPHRRLFEPGSPPPVRAPAALAALALNRPRER